MFSQSVFFQLWIGFGVPITFVSIFFFQLFSNWLAGILVLNCTPMIFIVSLSLLALDLFFCYLESFLNLFRNQSEPRNVEVFLLEASMAIGYCRCLRLSVRPCVNHLLVRALTRDPFKLGSPNLNHRCKRPWLRSLLFWGVIDFYLQGQICLRSENLPHFELVRAKTNHPFKLRPSNMDQICKIPWLRFLVFWGLIQLDNLTNFQNPVYLHRFCVFDIVVRLT